MTIANKTQKKVSTAYKTCNEAVMNLENLTIIKGSTKLAQIFAVAKVLEWAVIGVNNVNDIEMKNMATQGNESLVARLEAMDINTLADTMVVAADATVAKEEVMKNRKNRKNYINYQCKMLRERLESSGDGLAANMLAKVAINMAKVAVSAAVAVTAVSEVLYEVDILISTLESGNTVFKAVTVAKEAAEAATEADEALATKEFEAAVKGAMIFGDINTKYQAVIFNLKNKVVKAKKAAEATERVAVTVEAGMVAEKALVAAEPTVAMEEEIMADAKAVVMAETNKVVKAAKNAVEVVNVLLNSVGNKIGGKLKKSKKLIKSKKLRISKKLKKSKKLRKSKRRR
jgi:hypothetical protein